MGNYRVEIGATDGFRYIGVEPPLDADQRSQALAEVGEDIAFQGIMNGRCLATTSGNPSYSELAVTTTLYRERVPVVANQLAEVLRRQGHSVDVDLEQRYIGAGGGYRLFGDKSKATLWQL
jgi:hypothetical protein